MPDLALLIALARSLLLSFADRQTGFNAAVQAGVGVGSIVYVAGAGPVGLCAAQSCLLLGAARVFVGDLKPDRLALAQSIGCVPINLAKLSGGSNDADEINKEIAKHLPPEQYGEHSTLVDAAIDAVGFECCGVGSEADKRVSEQVINTCIKVRLYTPIHALARPRAAGLTPALLLALAVWSRELR